MKHSNELLYGILFPEIDTLNDLLFVPRDHAEHLVQTYKVLDEAKTWGEVLERAPENVYAELVAQNQLDLESSIERYEARYASGEFSIDELEGKGITIPDDSDPFNGDALRDEGFYPPMVGTLMMKWVPEEIQSVFSTVESDIHGATWMKFKPENKDKLVEAFTAFGYTCTEDPATIYAASGLSDEEYEDSYGGRS